MSFCLRCHRTLITATYGTQTVLLDPVPTTYAAVEEHHIFPEDGDRIFRSTALVEHHVVCPVALREQAQHQTQYKKAAHARRKGV